MNADELCWLSLSEQSALVQRRAISPRELTAAILDRIDRVNPRLNAFITVLREQAEREAARAEQELAAGQSRGPLHGLPISLKDLYDTAGVRTTGGAKILADRVPQQDCTVTRRLREAGAVIVGKTNLHEFAFGVTSANPHFGPVRNPWAPDRVPGGSSGGSGAAVAAGMGAASLGSDTGGSIRIPAALCGITGLKPTYGRVSRAGVLPLAWSLDHAGPMTRTVEDAALVLQTIAGYDPADPASSRAPVPNFRAELQDGIRGLRFGVPRRYFYTELSPDVEGAVEAALAELERLGARRVDTELSYIDYALDAMESIILPEAVSVHLQWLRERRADYGEDVRDRLLAALAIPAVQYVDGQRVRRLIAQGFSEALRQVDVLVTPTTAIPAPPAAGFRDPRLLTRFTAPINLTGLPACAVPCGFSTEGLPLSIQIIGRAFDEATVLRFAWAYEQATEWHRRRPPLAAEAS
jgi:aspartyl-tRNA(Asn)/glutamyl-tRNA(Gln) amidotransferase subunit A